MVTAFPPQPRTPFTVLLAGGAGTRLHELTQTDCKPALPFGTGGARIVDFTLANAARSGLSQVLVATQYCPATLERHLTRRWHGALGNLTVRNGHALRGRAGGFRGTADAVAANMAEIDAAAPSEVVVLSGDHVYHMDYRPMIDRHRQTGASVTIAAQAVPRAKARAFGVLQTAPDGRILTFAEKPADPAPAHGHPDQALASMGIYVFDWPWLRDALMLDAAEPGSAHDFGHDILPRAVAEQGAWAFDTGSAYWRDVGTLDSYRLSQLDFAPGRTPPFDPPGGLRPSATVANLRDSILMPGARAMAGARLTEALVAPGAVVPAGMVVGECPAEDAQWFRVTPGGTTLVTAAMLARRAAEQPRLYPVPARPDLSVRIA